MGRRVPVISGWAIFAQSGALLGTINQNFGRKSQDRPGPIVLNQQSRPTLTAYRQTADKNETGVERFCECLTSGGVVASHNGDSAALTTSVRENR